jgi:hypothetical protein
MDYQEQFFKGCIEGNLTNVQEAFKHNIDVKDFIDNALIEVCGKGFLDIAEYLVNSPDVPVKPNIHAKNDKALFWACSFQKYNTVEFLLSQGADMSVNDYAPFRELIQSYEVFNAWAKKNHTPEQLADSGKANYQEDYANIVEKVWPKLVNDLNTSNELVQAITSWAMENNIANVMNYMIEAYFPLINPSLQESILNKAIKNDNVLLFEKVQKEVYVDLEAVVKQVVDFDSDLICKNVIDSSLDQISDDGKFELLAYVISKNDISLVQKFVDHNSIANEEILLLVALAQDNLDIFNLLKDKITHTEEGLAGLITSFDLPIKESLNLVKHIDLEKYTNNTDIILNNDDSYENELFNEDSLLPKAYAEKTFSNNREAFVNLLLYRNTNSYNTAHEDLSGFNYLIENRKFLDIKDELIIQYIVEQNYDLGDSMNYHKEALSNFKNMVDKLIEEKVDLSLDTNGFLIQIAAKYDLTDLITLLAKNGSSIDNFVGRYENKDNWLTEKQYEKLNGADYNNDRMYDIYKKFDATNSFEDSTIEVCKSLVSANKTNKPRF